MGNINVSDEPCVRCGFDDEFTIDYYNNGKEFVFCRNCGTIKEDLSDPIKDREK